MIICTDGSYLLGKYVGGWACVIKHKGQTYELMGGMKAASAEEAEITAVIKALEVVPVGTACTIFSDSMLVEKSITQFRKWQVCNSYPRWAEKIKPQVHRLNELVALRQPLMINIGGHPAPGNLRCDVLAKKAAHSLLARKQRYQAKPKPKPQAQVMPSPAQLQPTATAVLPAWML